MIVDKVMDIFIYDNDITFYYMILKSETILRQIG